MSQHKTKRTALNKPKLIQLIHIGKSKLCLDDDTYRSLLVGMTGKDSTKAMNLLELQTVLARMKKLGFKPTRATPTTQKTSKDNGTTDQLNLIRHLWHSLHELGAVRVNTETAMASYIKKQSGVSIDELDMVQASRVIESLKKWQQRVEYKILSSQ
ncbi:gp16 family protein [Moraxella bovoculi]|uniref:gp16 family protein n=1 Tax=Moraxella bovoculi TaxID=386891 RepID=UPI000624A6E5|nr:regulatory protein GemA [Moraxella bovoculi]AKG11483.1 hypothetical protein AAX07_05175 [Moraxella bovoculi]